MDAIDGFGLDALQNVGLPETGDLVVTRGGEPHIVTEWGKILTSYLSLWQYRLWSFERRDTKLERFLPKNQHNQSKFMNFENWCNSENLKVCHHFNNKVIQNKK